MAVLVVAVAVAAVAAVKECGVAKQREALSTLSLYAAMFAFLLYASSRASKVSE